MQHGSKNTSTSSGLDEDEVPFKATSGNKELVDEEDEILARFTTRLGLDVSLGIGHQRLSSLDLEGVAAWLKQEEPVRVITLSGAGISTAAGIPDFRTPNLGLYANLHHYNLPHPSAIFDINFLKTNPEPFFNLAKQLYPGRFKPTLAHYFLRLLHKKGLLLRHYTQNIDGLDRIAGIPSEAVVEAHGTFMTSHCLDCGSPHELAWLKKEVFADRIPRCSLKCNDAACGGLVKPDIVFFGESLPQLFAERIKEDFPRCTILIILGTSLHVAPFCQLIGLVESDVPRAYFNKEMSSAATAVEDGLMALLSGASSAGLRCGQVDNYRDVFVKGTCDETCLKLADLLGWKEELESLFKTEHERLDALIGLDPDLASN